MTNRLMYQPHPDQETLFAGNPSNLVAATQNIQPIRFDDLLETRQIIWELKDCITSWNPHLLPFFATGGIPYLMPLMEVLRRHGDLHFIDGKHFHLFPGLSWGGSIEGKSSEQYFAERFGQVLLGVNCRDEALRVLVIDTTNSGNAVNKAVTACRMALETGGVKPKNILFRFIGIVNSTHEEAKRPSANKTLVCGVEKAAYILMPSGFTPTYPLVDRQFSEFTTPGEAPLSSFEISYWLAGNIPTEDNADLIGVEAIHESLRTATNARAGRLKIDYGNGESQQETGVGNLPGRLLHVLSLSLDDVPWVRMLAINSLPPLPPEPEVLSVGAKEFSEGGLRLVELTSMDPSEAINELGNLPRLLSDVEVYWLGTQQPPPRRIARKVRASLEKRTCTATEALKYFRLGFPELASGDPSNDSSAAWWDRQIRSISNEKLADQTELIDSVADCIGVNDPINTNHETSEQYDLALDFVIVVGGAEEARNRLLDLNAKGLSLDDFNQHLNKEWPTADKALKYREPTNEQVAMHFVIECGGLQQAMDCLEFWIARNSTRNDVQL